MAIMMRSLGLPARTSVTLRAGNGHLVKTSPVSGTFELYLQADGSLMEEDSHRRFFPIRDADGRLAGIAGQESILLAALLAGANDDAAADTQNEEGPPPARKGWWQRRAFA